MRKIKPNKKEIEKKKKKVDKLMQELFHYHGTVHDEAKTMEIVKEMADLEPDEPTPAEKVASIYVDYHRTAEDKNFRRRHIGFFYARAFAI